jgi:prepilin-type processing-associated H-X9-DG protein
MSQPSPHYEPPQPNALILRFTNMKRTITIVGILVVSFTLAAIIAFPMLFDNSHKISPTIKCLSSMRTVGIGLLMYAQDYDDKLPPAEKWMTVTQPYTKSPKDYICPVIKTENPKAASSYALDTRLSGESLENLKQPAEVILVYDSTRTDWDAADPGQTFATRHNGGKDKLGNVIFADGHTKPITKEQFAAASLTKVVDKQ